jgi:predicted RNA methylase
VAYARLLGPGEWEVGPVQGGLRAFGTLETEAAADLAARLRGVGLGGRPLQVEVVPRLKRPAVRAARTRDARRRRDTTPGFTRRGARTDPEGKVSLTPEALALEIGQRWRGKRVVDAGCGVGGNAIGFARAGCAVTAIERDPHRLSLARHNAHLYDVEEQIRFVEGDARPLIPTLEADMLFVDPPWGVEWDRARTTVADLPLFGDILDLFHCTGRFEYLVAKVPPSFDPAIVAGVNARAVFGEAEGDYRRVKFVLLEMRLSTAREKAPR